MVHPTRAHITSDDEPVRFTVDDLLDGATAAVHEHRRSATVAHVTALLGAPSGSIYHRFASRDAFFAAAWIRPCAATTHSSTA